MNATMNNRIGVAKANRRRGSVAVYTVVTLVALSGIISLAVDLGRVRLVKGELQAAADSAARAAAMKLTYSVQQAKDAAVATAALNYADGSSVALQVNQDVEFGTWDAATQSFTVLTGVAQAGANAVRVTAKRTQSRQSAITLTFAPVIGKTRCDVEATSIAMVTFGGYGVVGLDWIAMSGNATDSYWSPSGYSGNSAGSRGSIASNGHIVLSGNSSIHGDAHPGTGKQVFGATAVWGSTTPLAGTLSYPNGSAGIYASQNNNNLIPNGNMSASSFKLGSNKSVTLPGGHYYFNNFEISSGGSLSFTGPATIYVYGNFTMSGNTATSGSTPTNLQLVMVPAPNGDPPGSVNIGSSAELYADVYAPQSAVTLSGNGDIYGSVLGKTVSMTGTSAIHYDMSLSGSPVVQLVK